MNIETKFAVNDLVHHKYSFPTKEQGTMIMEVMQIDASVCMGGIQIFYQCRILHPEYEHRFNKPSYYTGVGMGANRDGKYLAVREDEIVKCSEEVATQIKNPPPPPPPANDDNPAMLSKAVRENMIESLKKRLEKLQAPDTTGDKPAL